VRQHRCGQAGHGSADSELEVIALAWDGISAPEPALVVRNVRSLNGRRTA
jgi:hypothetical protein